jgi:hypothetical protein
MKHLTLSLLLIFTSTFFFASCDKKDDSPSTQSIIQQGKWRITLFNDSGTDETYHFTGYEFTFNTNGSVVAVKNTTTVNGTWSTGNDDSKSKLILNFGTTVNFNDLNEDWQILEKNSSKIRMQHISGGNGTTDLLTFEKL